MADKCSVDIRHLAHHPALVGAGGGGRVLWEPSKVEQRYDAVVAVVRDGMRVTEVAEKFGVHRDTVYAWPICLRLRRR
jgi:predicted dehydrogenase